MVWDQTIVAAISAGVATFITAYGNFVLNRRKLNHQLEQEELQRLFSESQKMRQELQAEVLANRERFVKLQEDNLKYAVENAELKARVRELESEINTLRNLVEAKSTPKTDNVHPAPLTPA